MALHLLLLLSCGVVSSATGGMGAPAPPSSMLSVPPSASVFASATASASPPRLGDDSPTPTPTSSPPVEIDGKVLPSWFAVAVAGVCIGIGLFQVFFGYRFFRVTLFVLGFITVGVTIFLLSWDHISDPNAMWYGLAMGALAGLLVGGVGAAIPRIGVFLVGGALGVVVALILNTTVLYRLYPSNPNLTLGVAGGVLGAIFGGLSILMMRVVVVASTSVVGSYATIRGIGYFAGNYPANEWALKDDIANGQTLPPEIYAYFAGMLALALVGMVVQFLYTAKKSNSDEKDEWEKEYDDSEFTLEALSGACPAQARWHVIWDLGGGCCCAACIVMGMYALLHSSVNQSPLLTHTQLHNMHTRVQTLTTTQHAHSRARARTHTHTHTHTHVHRQE